MKHLIFSFIFVGVVFFANNVFAETIYGAKDLPVTTNLKIKEVKNLPSNTSGQSTIVTTYDDGTIMTSMPNSPYPPIITWQFPDGSRYQTKPGTTDQYIKTVEANKNNTQQNKNQTSVTLPKTSAPTDVNLLNRIVPPNLFTGDAGENTLGRLLNQLFYVGLVAAVILALVMIIRGGIEYMTIDAITSKERGKQRVKAALGGLVLSFSAILILNTINPSLTSLNIMFASLKEIGDVTVNGTIYGLNSYSRLDPLTGTVTSKMSDQELQAYTLQKIKEMGFSNLSPADKAAFFPNGGTDEEWLGLASAMMKYESGFDPNTTYTEGFTNSKGQRLVSTGLFQLSEDSVRGYGFNYTTQDLKDPYKNIDAGLHILKNWVEKDGVISGPGNKGGARYWSVLRPTGKLQDVRKEMVR